MLLTYLDGRSADDRLFDQPDDIQRLHMVRCMDLNPSTPENWPRDLIDKLLAIRRLHGQSRFHEELGKILTRGV